MFTTVKRGITVANDSDGISKQDLVGQLIVFRVTAYEAAAQTQHGTQKQADVDLLICSGPKKGQEVSGWRCWGNLAGQMSAQGSEPVVAKIVAGPVKPGQTHPSWFGVDVAVSDSEFAVAQSMTTAKAPF